MLSIIIPAYNEADNIAHTAEVITSLMNKNEIMHEIIFIDDGSRDNTWEVITKVACSNIHGVRFSRNFGKEGAIFAGLREADGDCVIVIDCDLQHPPELIVDMYGTWQSGFEVVEAVKASRGREGLFYKLFAKMFYGMMKSSSDMNLDRASDYKLLDRKVVDTLLSMPERLTFFRALSSWVGFNKTQIEFNVQPRFAGKTKWSFKKLFKFAVSNLTSFTNLPMQLVTLMGVVFLVLSIAVGIKTLYDYFTGSAAAGFSTVILLILIIGAFLMLGLGIIGYYISKIYEEIKFRPRYIVNQRTTERDSKKNDEK